MDERIHERPVRRFDDDDFRPGHLLLHAIEELLALCAVGRDVHHLNCLAHRLADANGLHDGTRERRCCDDHVLRTAGRRDDDTRSHGQAACLLPVLAADPDHCHNQDWYEDQHDPRALRELGHGKDDGNDARRDGSDGVEHDAPSPAGATGGEPVANHARLGQGEGGEHAHGVERDEQLDAAIEGDHEDDRQRGQDDDAGVESEALAAEGELAREVAVPRQD